MLVVPTEVGPPDILLLVGGRREAPPNIFIHFVTLRYTSFYKYIMYMLIAYSLLTIGSIKYIYNLMVGRATNHHKDIIPPEVPAEAQLKRY